MGSEGIRKRLVDVYTHNLLRLKPEDFPPELQGEFGRFREGLAGSR
jgi:hypothetical protein